MDIYLNKANKSMVSINLTLIFTLIDQILLNYTKKYT